MAKVSMGTQLFMLITDPDNDAIKKIVKVDCPNEIGAGNDDVEEIDNTCLEADVKATLDGFINTGEATIALGVDKEYESHKILYRMANNLTADGKKSVKWAIGMPDGRQFIEPVLNQDKSDWILPDTREWYYFEGRVKSFPLDTVSIGSKVSVTATLKRTTRLFWSEGELTGTGYPDKYKLTPDTNPYYLLVNGKTIAAPLAANASDTDIKAALELLDNVTTATVTDKTTFFEVELTPKGVLTAVGADVEEV